MTSIPTEHYVAIDAQSSSPLLLLFALAPPRRSFHRPSAEPATHHFTYRAAALVISDASDGGAHVNLLDH